MVYIFASVRKVCLDSICSRKNSIVLLYLKLLTLVAFHVGEVWIARGENKRLKDGYDNVVAVEEFMIVLKMLLPHILVLCVAIRRTW
jgi:hypothetical protein